MLSKTRSTYHHGDLRDALIAEAIAQIEGGGLEAFSLRGCATRLGVDAAAAYRHFRSKEALLAEVAQVGTYRLARRMEQAVTRARRRSPAERMIALGKGYVAHAMEQPELYRATFAVRGQLDDKGPALAGETGKTAFELLSEVLDQLLASNQIAPSKREDAEIFAWSTLHGFVALYQDGVLKPTGKQLTRATEQLCVNVIDGLRGGY